MSIREEELIINIEDSMTEHFKQGIQDFESNRIHSPSCSCWLCLYRHSKKEPSRKRGRHFDFLTFLIFDLINMPPCLRLFPNKYKKIPSRRIARRVIRRLFSPEMKGYLNEFSKGKTKEHAFRYIMENRSSRSGFDDRLLEIEFGRYWQAEGHVIRRRGEFRKSIKPFLLAQKISKFVRAQPDHMATQREIIRKCCSNKKVADLKALHWMLRKYGIVVEQYEKWQPIIYIWKKPSF